LKQVANDNNCDKYFTYRHQVKKASWDDAAGKWNLVVLDMDKELEYNDSCDILINASGVLK
jgi:cation diffusion facilitator CzcD-associated flavoprotein CzcO